MKTKYLVFAALGVAAVLLLRSDKAAGLRKDIADNAGKWKDKLGKWADDSSDQLSDLKETLSKQVAGLGETARKKMQAILSEGTKTAKGIKASAEEQLS